MEGLLDRMGKVRKKVNVHLPVEVYERRKHISEACNVSIPKAFLIHDEIVAKVLRKNKRQNGKTRFEIEL